jgi:hypothetical protein
MFKQYTSIATVFKPSTNIYLLLSPSFLSFPTTLQNQIIEAERKCRHETFEHESSEK